MSTRIPARPAQQSPAGPADETSAVPADRNPAADPPGRLRAAVTSQFGDFPPQIWTLFTGVIINRLGYLVTPFLVFYLGSRGIAADRMPYVLGALGAGNLIGPALGGVLADRVGRRPTIVAALLGTALSQGMLFLAPNIATLAAAAALLSMTGSSAPPAAYAVLADTVPQEQRRSAFSLFSWAINIGTAVSGAAGGFLAAHGYWMLFAIDAGTSLGYAALVFVKLPADRGARPDKGAAAPTASPSGSAGYGVVFRDRLLLVLLLISGIGFLIYSLSEVDLPLAIHGNGLSPTVLGMMAVINAGLVVLLQPTATRVLRRFSQVPVYTVGSLLIAAGIALTGVAHRPYQVALTVVVWSVGEVSVSGIGGAIVADLAPDEARGRYQGAFTWVWGFGRFAALTVGAAAYTVDPALLWWGTAVVGVLATAGFVAAAPAVARRHAAPAPVTESSQPADDALVSEPAQSVGAAAV